MRKLILVLSGIVLLVALWAPTASAQGKRVEYTWTLAALGQGGWIGGPMFEDGSVGGGGALSVDYGQVLANFRPTILTEDDEEISVCFDVVIGSLQVTCPPKTSPSSV